MAMGYDPFRELDRVASALMDPRTQGPRQMPMDLYREGDRYILNAELPGIDPGSVDIEFDGQTLTIRAERNVRGNEGVKWLVRERQSAQFVRQLNIGRDIDTDGIHAHYENGVLNVVIPVSDRAKPRKIAVSEGPIRSVDVGQSSDAGALEGQQSRQEGQPARQEGQQAWQEGQQSRQQGSTATEVE